MKASIVLETGEARELHHFAVLAGYGAEAINPYLVFHTISELVDTKDYKSSESNFIKASGKAILKIMSKMGISTLKSYCGAQIFDAVGISESVVDKYFLDNINRRNGLKQIQEETLNRFSMTNFKLDSEKSLDGGEIVLQNKRRKAFLSRMIQIYKKQSE